MFDQQSECEIECQTENEGENETIILPSEPRWSGDIQQYNCLLYTSPSPRDRQKSRMPSSA